MKRHGYPKDVRLRTTAEFRRVYNGGVRAGDRHLLVFAAENGQEPSRCGVSVSKKHGNAVARARLKRLLREAFRLERERLPGGLDLILIPRRNSGATLEDYRRSLVKLAGKLARRLREAPSS